ncbi:MAG: hypothetical protein HRT71_15735 [Flavobacteriales bacterium]|nr:hypothetical protein [Flavobacteriales bacterium]
MDQAYLDIINRNLELISKSSPQCITMYQFVDANNRSLIEVDELIAKMVELDFIELDDNDNTKYYLTENGYDCLEAGGCRVPGSKTKSEKEKNVSKSKEGAWIIDHFGSKREFNFSVYFLLFLTALIASIYGVGFGDSETNSLPSRRVTEEELNSGKFINHPDTHYIMPFPNR